MAPELGFFISDILFSITIFSFLDEYLWINARYSVMNENFEKIVVSLEENTLPSKGGIRHIKAWKINEIRLKDIRKD